MAKEEDGDPCASVWTMIATAESTVVERAGWVHEEGKGESGAGHDSSDHEMEEDGRVSAERQPTTRSKRERAMAIFSRSE